jgi:transcriptional regulator with PAS, ATPase and Fis domain
MRKEKWRGGFAAGITLIPGRSGRRGRAISAGLARFLEVHAAAKQFADYDVPVLIRRETGTGKEEFARLIHLSSRRKEQPFLPINCASLPETIFESELFGHTKGAFAGADTEKKGLPEAAETGTDFLNEMTG